MVARRTSVDADMRVAFSRQPASECVRRAFPFRTDTPAIQCSQELTIAPNQTQTWAASVGREICPHMITPAFLIISLDYQNGHERAPSHRGTLTLSPTIFNI
jgi:hypothetical protein